MEAARSKLPRIDQPKSAAVGEKALAAWKGVGFSSVIFMINNNLENMDTYNIINI